MTGVDLVLVGAPGAGKTSIGGRVAARLGLPFTDTDTEVEELFGQPRAEIYADHGPDAFRAAEEQVTLLGLSHPGILAVGSSAIESDAVRAALPGRSVVWLQVSALHAARRLGLGALGMSVLVTLRSELQEGIARRSPAWAAVATHIIDTDRLDLETVVQQVRHVLEGVQT